MLWFHHIICQIGFRGWLVSLKYKNLHLAYSICSVRSPSTDDIHRQRLRIIGKMNGLLLFVFGVSGKYYPSYAIWSLFVGMKGDSIFRMDHRDI